MRNFRCKWQEITSGSSGPPWLSCPRRHRGSSWALPAPGDGWVMLVGLSQRCFQVHGPPASQSSHLSPTQDNLIIVTRLSQCTRCHPWWERLLNFLPHQPEHMWSLFANHQDLGGSEVPCSRGTEWTRNGLFKKKYIYLFTYLFLSLFIGCVGSSLLRAGFL